jgi:membrane-associated protease RseP (regulator of RpoE activity)
LLLRRLVPGGLLVLSAGSAFFAGAIATRTGTSPQSFWQVLAFASFVLLGVGAHAFGHFVVARRNGVDAWFPYFVPQLNVSGTGGAYVKMQWPIDDRSTLVRIFAAGPIAGFIVSVPMVFVGMALSTTMPRPSGNFIVLGDSLITLAVQHVVFPALPESEVVIAHPLLVAGSVGLNFSLWHLFPVGRFDGGRVVYGLLGHRRALVVSWVTIVGLVALSFVSPVWFGFAALGSLTLIRLKRQHPLESHTQQLSTATIALACTMVVLFVLTFVPVPARLGP